MLDTLSMIVDDLMCKTVKPCRARDSLAVPAQIMRERDCDAVPVVDAETRVVGMITAGDIRMALHLTGKSHDDVRVYEVMERNVPACMPYDSAAHATKMMQREHVGRLPVIDAMERLVGLVTLHDIARVAERAWKPRMLEAPLDEVA